MPYLGTNLATNLATVLGTNIGGIDNAVEGIFGNKLQEWWDARYGYTLDGGGTVLTLTGQKRGVVLAPAAAGNQPTWIASAALLNGKPGIAGDAGAKCLGTDPGSGDISPPLWSGGGSAYVYCIGYQVGDGLAGQADLSFKAADGGGNVCMNLVDHNLAANIVDVATSNDAFNLDPDPEDTTSSHLTEQWANSSVPEACASFDGADATPAPMNTGIRADCVTFGFCGNETGAAQSTGRVIAHVGVLNAIPTAGERAALLAYAQATWGTP